MTKRLIISVLPLAIVVLALGRVLGQEPLPEAGPPLSAPPPSMGYGDGDPPTLMPPAFAPPEAAPPAFVPFDAATPTFAPPAAAPLDTPPPEIAAGGPKMDRFGEGGLGGFGMGGAGMGGPGYGATWYPSRPATGAAPGEELGLVRQSLSGVAPVWRNGGDMLMLSGSVRNSLFFTDAILPDSHRPFPNELWNISLGTNYMHKFDNGWSGMVGINFGSASDKPFHSINEMTVGFLSFLQVPVWNARDAWRFMLIYSPVGNLNFPIPGVAYLWNPSDTLHVSIGLPFSVMWRPIDDLTINVFYLPVTTVNARATYRVVGPVFVFGGFEWLQEAYLLADRENVADRFLGYEKRLVAGVRWDVWRHAALELSAGYAFDRYYGVGQNQIGNLHDQVNIDPGAFLSTTFRYRF